MTLVLILSETMRRTANRPRVAECTMRTNPPMPLLPWCRRREIGIMIATMTRKVARVSSHVMAMLARYGSFPIKIPHSDSVLNMIFRIVALFKIVSSRNFQFWYKRMGQAYRMAKTIEKNRGNQSNGTLAILLVRLCFATVTKRTAINTRKNNA